ncbi:uncharacterized protein LOC131430944 [Malaya genurostris]|uniref:uncharacterized protein LOC131430944 n=1 Tax=Malaya genurostris TaxID=325434 RepID=UPI0026F3BB31|nr:uncharacterized protein LOC131430944 [Malaya genurostris]
MKAIKFLALTVSLCQYLSCDGTVNAQANNDDEFINPNWIKPDPWSRHDREMRKKQTARAEECQCPPVPQCDPIEKSLLTTAKVETIDKPDDNNRLAMVFYKKFVTRLFDDSQLMPDDASAYLLRNVQFKVTRKQVQDLKQATTARDIDGIVAAIVEQSKGSGYRPVMESFCWNISLFFSRLSENVYLLYFLLPTVCLPAAYILVKILSRIMHIHPAIIVFLLFTTISFFITFDECNRKLELESLAKLMHHDTTNPCDTQHKANRGVTDWLTGLFGQSDEAKCMEHLRKTLGASRKICDPSQVFMVMVAKIQLSYFETFFVKIIEIFKTSTASSGFVESFLIKILLILLVYVLVKTVLKYGISGSFNFLGNMLTGSHSNGAVPQNALPGGQTTQQAIPGAMPASFNFKINIDHGRKKITRPDINRIEEIADNGKPKPLAVAQSSKESPKKFEDGSGDASVPDEISDSGSDNESIHVECHLPEFDGNRRTHVIERSSTGNANFAI